MSFRGEVEVLNGYREPYEGNIANFRKIPQLRERNLGKCLYRGALWG